MDDEAVLGELLGNVASRDYVPRLMEVARRDLPNAPYQANPDYRWMKLMLRAGVPEAEILSSFHHPSIRTKAVAAMSERDARWVIEKGATPAASLAALAKLNDPHAWNSFVEDVVHDEYFRWIVEHTPASALAQLLPVLKVSPSRAATAREVATYRGVIPPEVSFLDTSAKVRLAAVKKVKDQSIVDAALRDTDPGVVLVAVRRSRSIEALDELAATLDQRADAQQRLISAVQERREQLVALDLVEKSLQRSEPVVARAALAMINDRGLLLGLYHHPELAPFLADRLQRITLRPRYFK
jgi:hypothetical protein